MNYQLEIKQIINYPRCRIYREFIRTLIKDRDIRTNGSSYLFYYITLCSYANYRSSYRRLEGITYLIGPGEWICKTSELSDWFRTKYQHQAISILEFLHNHHYITYRRLERGQLIKFSINNWKEYNAALEYNYPCQKDIGFFFFPVATVHELISIGKCSEMDIVLDLWIHGIYNDEHVKGSDIGPVVYFCNYTGTPLVSYTELGHRWNISKATVYRTLTKLQDKEYISVVSFTGKHGSLIYLSNYLPTMFNINDVIIDKEDIAMVFQMSIRVSEDDDSLISDISDAQIPLEKVCVSLDEVCVSKSHIHIILQKIARLLATQEFPCSKSNKSPYILYTQLSQHESQNNAWINKG